MTYKALDIQRYVFTKNDSLFLDANIWVYVYGPQKPHTWMVDVYSEALKKALIAQSKIYIDVLVVSEFINTCSRIRWGLLNHSHKDFKKFRQSQDFKPIAHGIAADIKSILRHCTRIANDFDALNIDDLIACYAAGDSDFNDQVIASLCKTKKLKLLTHDGDFFDQGIAILTANKKLLR